MVKGPWGSEISTIPLDDPKSIKKSWNILEQHPLGRVTNPLKNPQKNPPGSYTVSPMNNSWNIQSEAMQRHARLFFWHQSAQAAWEASSLAPVCAGHSKEALQVIRQFAMDNGLFIYN